MNKIIEIRNRFKREKNMDSYQVIPAYADWLENEIVKKENANSGYPLLGDVTAAEVDIIVDALYDYQLHIMGIKELEETNFVVKIILDKLTKDLPEID